MNAGEAKMPLGRIPLALSAFIVFACLEVTRSALAAETPGQSDWWNPSWTVRREVEVQWGSAGLPGKEIAAVSFLTGGLAQDKLQDVRVVSEKGPVRHKVIQGGPGDFARIAFELEPGTSRYWIYYGNPKARTAETDWKMQRGLLLETRRYRGGNPDSLRGMRDVAAKSSPKLGADYVPQVFHGFNIFGDSENYVSLYTGAISAPEAGEYVFVTSSDDASFLLVDGRAVAEWPGWHGASGEARPHMQGKVTLKAGLHDFEYLHVNGSGDGVAAAYWQPPSADKIAPIPEAAFPQVFTGRLKGMEMKGQSAAADFDVDGIDECFVAERYLARYRFHDTSSGARGASVEWDFGDGTTARGPTADHVYLADGEYKVKMAITYAGGRAEVANRIRAQRLWRSQAAGKLAGFEEYSGVFAAYDLAKLAPASLEALYAVYAAAERNQERLAVARAAAARASECSDSFYFDAVMALHQSLRDSKKVDEGLRLLRTAEERLKGDRRLRAKVIRETGDVLFYYVEDLDGALQEYDKVVGRCQGLEDDIVRVTKIKIGDIHRRKGDYAKAAANYADAEKLKLDKRTDEAQAVRRGVLEHQVEEYLRRGDPDEASDALSALEWEFPMERLRGPSSILRARIATARKNWEEAAKQLDDFVRVAPGSEYAAECLFMAAEAHTQLGRPDVARQCFERLAKDYRDSEFSAAAAEKLKKLGPQEGAPVKEGATR